MKKAFTLIEVIVSIGIIGLIISTLLLVIYNIQLSQSRMIFGKTIAKKAEFYVIKNIVDQSLYLYSSDITNYIYNILKSSLSNDTDFKEIKINNINVSLCQSSEKVVENLYLLNVKAEGNVNDNNLFNNKNIYKYYFSVDMDYEILTIKQKEKIKVIIPLTMIRYLGQDNTPVGNGSGQNSLEDTISY